MLPYTCGNTLTHWLKGIGAMDLKRLMTDHPHSVGESYGEHMRVALSFAGPLAVASAAAFVHAFLPFLCVTTASRTVKKLHARIVSRAPRAPLGAASSTSPDSLPLWDPVI
jgi:hypothetical protein